MRCAETCYVQGSLTSWKVKAKSIQLEEQAQARVVLQETEQVEIGKNAKLVGNFDSEKELFLLFSRFARQLRNMPFYFDRAGGDPRASRSRSRRCAAGRPPTPRRRHRLPRRRRQAPVRATAAKGNVQKPGGSLASEVLDAGQELPDQLFFSLVLLERERRTSRTARDAQGGRRAGEAAPRTRLRGAAPYPPGPFGAASGAGRRSASRGGADSESLCGRSPDAVQGSLAPFDDARRRRRRQPRGPRPTPVSVEREPGRAARPAATDEEKALQEAASRLEDGGPTEATTRIPLRLDTARSASADPGTAVRLSARYRRLVSLAQASPQRHAGAGSGGVPVSPPSP